MDLSNASTLLYRIEFQILSRLDDVVIDSLSAIDSNLLLSYFIPTSKDYNINFAPNVAFNLTLPLCQHENPKVQEAAQHFIQRWSLIISTICPIDFIVSLQNLIQKNPDHSKYIYVFMPSLGNAISLMSEDEVLHSFPLIQRIFHLVPPHKQSEIPKSVWQAIGKYSPETEILTLLRKNLDVKFASTAPFLIQKNPKKFTGFIFKEALSSYLNEFLKNAPQKYKIDIDEALNRVRKDCEQLGTAGFTSTCQMLGNLIRYNTYDLTETQQSEIKGILYILNSFLSDETCSAHETNSILMTLIEGANKNLFEREQLKKMVNQFQYKEECPQLQITLLKLYIYCMEQDSDNSVAEKALLGFSPWKGEIYIQYLEIIGENYKFLKQINQDLVIKILWSIFHPLPLELPVANSIVKFLLKLSPRDVLDSRVDSNIDYLFDTYFGMCDLELSKSTLLLAKQYKYSPSITKIDLFKKYNENYISLMKNADTSLVKELATSGLIAPQSRHGLLVVMQNQPGSYADFIVPLVNLLYLFCNAIGITKDVDACFSRCGLQKPEINEDIISIDELNSLFSKVEGSFSSSSFFAFLGTAIDTLSVLSSEKSNWSQVNQNVFAKAALLAANLILLSPKHVLNLLASLSRLRNKKGKYKVFDKETNSAASSYAEAYRIVESAPIPFKYSVDFLLYANARYSSEEVIKLFPKYVYEALGKSRMICDIYLKDLKQPLQPLKTFLSFVGIEEHVDWVNVCTQVIPCHEWMIRAGDQRLIKCLDHLDEETKRILDLRFSLIKNMPKPLTELNETFDKRPSFIRLNDLKIESGPIVHPKDNKATKPGQIQITKLPGMPIKSSESFEVTSSVGFIKTVNAFVEEEEEDVKEENDEYKGTLFELISFLWHSKMELPESIKPENLEALALKHSNNAKMLVGFFSWCNSHKYKIDLEKWENQIEIKHYTTDWLIAIAMFASNVHCPFHQIPLGIKNLFQKCLTSFGFPEIEKEALVDGYYHLKGVKWLIIRNIIMIDISYFNEYPLLVSELTRNMDTFQRYLNEIDANDDEKVNVQMFAGINDIIFHPSEDQMMLTSQLPTNRKFHSRLLTFKEMSEIPKQTKISNEILHSIINALQKAKNVSFNYFTLFMNLKLTDEEYERIYEIFFKSTKDIDLISKFIFPSLYISNASKNSSLEEQAIQFYSEMPPSSARIFFRSLLCSFSPPISQSLIVRIEAKLKEVFPELCYSGFAKNGLKMWPDSLPLSKLRFGSIDSRNTGELLMNDMKIPCRESILIHRLLLRLPDEQLVNVIKPDSSNIFFSYKAEISRALLETATSLQASSRFALDAVKQVCDTLELKNAVILIANKEFFQRPNFLNVILSFAYLKNRAKVENNQYVIDYIQMFSNPESNWNAEERKKIFFSLNNDDCFSELIHPSS